MLLNFGAKNFYSFREGVDVSLELGSNCPKEISKGKKVTNILCIKGANGSGKTNVIKILSFLKYFCCDSWNQKPDEELHVRSFFSSIDPIEIYCEFITDQVRYLYELKVTKNNVVNEKISRKKTRYTLLFEREENKILNCPKEFSEIKEIKLRSNASIISTANQYQFETFKNIYSFFHQMNTNVHWFGRYDFTGSAEFVSKYYNDNPQVLKAAIEILKVSDLGISDVQIESKKNEKNEEIFFSKFYHDANVEENHLNFLEQSSGTQTIFKYFPYYFWTLNQGGILAMDEFDKDLHPHILPKIIDVFNNESTNPKNAQLIFTAHNTEVMDLLGKYRTFLVNKEKSESYGYRLDEIAGEMIRNDRTISTIYNKGKIGGVPSL